MVHYAPPKSARKKAGPPRTPINELADELLINIMANLDNSDICRLRLACKKVWGSSFTVIGDRTTTLYVHENTHSLKKLQAICRSSALSNHIEEIVLLGKPSAMWSDIHKVQKAISAAHCPTNGLARSDSIHVSVFRPWPAALSEHGKERKVYTSSGKASEMAVDPMMPFDVVYSLLVDALSSLPRLRKITFSESLDPQKLHCSLNAVTQCTINRAASRWNLPSDGLAALVDTTIRRVKSRSDAEILYGLLASSRLHITKFQVECELPFMDKIADSLRFRTTRPLSELELTMDENWGVNDTHRTYKSLIEHSADVLRTLRITFRPNASVTFPTVHRSHQLVELLGASEDHEETLNHGVQEVSRTLNMPRLETLIIEYRPQRVVQHVACCNKLETPILMVSEHVYRPIYQHLPASAIARFCELLKPVKRLVLTNVMITGVTTVREILQTLARGDNGLGHMEWTMSCFKHHPQCQGPSTTSCNRQACGVYTPSPGHDRWIDVQAVANELGVSLDTERQVWDFGEYVMRVKRDAELMKD